LVYSTFLGGSGNDQATCIAVDGIGNVYVAGYTTSLNSRRLTLTGLHPRVQNDVLRDESQHEWPRTGLFHYLGGNGNDFADAIAVDASGNAYITGQTDSPNFPTKNAATAAMPDSMMRL